MVSKLFIKLEYLKSVTYLTDYIFLLYIRKITLKNIYLVKMISTVFYFPNYNSENYIFAVFINPAVGAPNYCTFIGTHLVQSISNLFYMYFKLNNNKHNNIF